MFFLPLLFQSTEVLAMCISSVCLILLGNIERNITLDEAVVKKQKQPSPTPHKRKPLCFYCSIEDLLSNSISAIPDIIIKKWMWTQKNVPLLFWLNCSHKMFFDKNTKRTPWRSGAGISVTALWLWKGRSCIADESHPTSPESKQGSFPSRLCCGWAKRSMDQWIVNAPSWNIILMLFPDWPPLLLILTGSVL